MGRVFKYIGMVAVAGFVVVAGLIGYAAFQQFTTADANGKTAVAALQVLSSDWQVAGKPDVFHDSLVNAAATPQGRAGIASMARLGQLVSAGEPSQTGYTVNAGKPDVATIEFPAVFTNGTAEVVITLAGEPGAMKMMKLDINNMKFAKSPGQRT
jgi:hypothetical protein